MKKPQVLKEAYLCSGKRGSYSFLSQDSKKWADPTEPHTGSWVTTLGSQNSGEVKYITSLNG